MPRGKLAAATAGQLPPGTEVVTIELRDLARDIVNALLTGFPAPALREAIEQVVHADGLIERRDPAAAADPYASVTPFEQLLHDH